MNAFTNNRNRTLGRWAFAVLAIGVMAAGGCSSNTGNGALIGGAAGATIGAIAGHNSRLGTAGGALIGGTLGAATGAMVGNQMDREQARESDAYVELHDPYWHEHGWYFVGYDAWNRPIYERRIGYDAWGRAVYERRVFVDYAAPTPVPPTAYVPPPAPAAPAPAPAAPAPAQTTETPPPSTSTPGGASAGANP